MPRKPRNFYEGGVYHLTQRGNNKAYIYDEQLDKAMFCSIIKETKQIYPFDLLYYVLMDNHYHMIVRQRKVPIGQIMHRINMYYSKYYNQKYNRTGSIFEKRYTSVVIKDRLQYLNTIFYNAYNPVKAKIVKHPQEYRWCAHLEVVSNQSYILDRISMLTLIDKNLSAAEETYEKLLDEKIKGIRMPRSKDELATRRYEIMETLLKEMVPDPNQAAALKDHDRSLKIVDLRKTVIKRLFSEGFSVADIATYLGVTPRTVRTYRGS